MHPRASLGTVDKDEVKLTEFRKHPMGVFFIYIQAIIGFIVAIGLAYFLIPSVFEDKDLAFSIANIFALIATLLLLVIVFIATYVYLQNRMIVTDRNITQILQFGLFSRKVSQLNLNNIEDVTVIQDGFFPNILNYGMLKIETAGEQANFEFGYCPHPNFQAKIILDAREKILGQA